MFVPRERALSAPVGAPLGGGVGASQGGNSDGATGRRLPSAEHGDGDIGVAFAGRSKASSAAAPWRTARRTVTDWQCRHGMLCASLTTEDEGDGARHRELLEAA